MFCFCFLRPTYYTLNKPLNILSKPSNEWAVIYNINEGRFFFFHCWINKLIINPASVWIWLVQTWLRVLKAVWPDLSGPQDLGPQGAVTCVDANLHAPKRSFLSTSGRHPGHTPAGFWVGASRLRCMLATQACVEKRTFRPRPNKVRPEEKKDHLYTLLRVHDTTRERERERVMLDTPPTKADWRIWCNTSSLFILIWGSLCSFYRSVPECICILLMLYLNYNLLFS